jgi:hypothetical protein
LDELSVPQASRLRPVHTNESPFTPLSGNGKGGSAIKVPDFGLKATPSPGTAFPPEEPAASMVLVWLMITALVTVDATGFWPSITAFSGLAVQVRVAALYASALLVSDAGQLIDGRQNDPPTSTSYPFTHNDVAA